MRACCADPLLWRLGVCLGAWSCRLGGGAAGVWRAGAPRRARAPRRGHKAVVFVLDELDAFARRPKQALLYTLLDALHRSDMQARAAPPSLALTPGARCNHACMGRHQCNHHRTRCKAASALCMAVLQGSACSRGSPRAQRRSGVWQPDARKRRRAVRGRVRQRVQRRDAHDGEARAVAFLVSQGAALLRLRAISCG